jgi:hypothetical protein
MAFSARTRACAALLTTGIGMTGCGSSAPTILNTERVERAIQDSSLAQRGIDPRVSCPSGVHQAKGRTFSCTAVVKRTTTKFVVSQLDDDGHVRYAAR